MDTIELDLTQKEYVFTTQIEDEKLLSKLEEVCEQTPDRMFNATNVKADNAIIYDTHQAKEFIHVDPKHHSVLNRFKDIVEENTLYATHAFNEQHPNHAKRNLAPNHTELQLDTLKVTTLWIAKYTKGRDDHVIVHDHFPAVWAWTFYLGEQFDEPLYIGEYKIPIERGKLVFFRGHVMHHVPVIEKEGWRYCIAGTIHNDFRHHKDYGFRHNNY